MKKKVFFKLINNSLRTLKFKLTGIVIKYD